MDEREPELISTPAESLYAELLLRSPRPGQDQVEELCSRFPEQAEELRALHDVRSLLLMGERPTGAAHPPTVAGFVCTRLLGRGGMGEVWEALELSADRRVALKLRPQLGDDERHAERWRREIQAIGRLRHANVVALYSAGESSGRSYIAQELVEGGRTLRAELEELRRVAQVPTQHERRTAERFALLADALEHAHGAGVLHRDIKPQNILLLPDATPKLADFGLAKMVGDASLSQTGEFVGTYLYASPEQVKGSAEHGPQSDIFSLGATLYECLTLERPFSGDSVQSIVEQILRGVPPAPRSVRRSIPTELSVICMKALEKRPERRFASAGELRDDLVRYLRNEPIRARAPSLSRRLQKWTQRHPTGATALGLSIAAFLAILKLFLESERRGDELVRANEALRSTNVELVEARNSASAEAEISKEVEGFLSSMFVAADPGQFGFGNLDLRTVIDNGCKRLRSGEVENLLVRARLLGQLGDLQIRLGGWSAALAMLKESDRLWQQLELADSPEALHVRGQYAIALADQGLVGEAQALLGPLVEHRRRSQMDPAAAFDVLLAQGALLLWEGRLDDGQRLLEEADEILDTLEFPDPMARLMLDGELGASAFLRGRLDEARGLLEASCKELEPLLPTGNTYAVNAFNTLGLVLIADGEPEQATELFERVLPIIEAKLGASHPRALNMSTNLAGAWTRLGRLEEAEQLLEGTIELARLDLGDGSPEVLVALGGLGTVFTAQRRFAEAAEVLEQVVAGRLELQGPDHNETVRARCGLGICYYYLGRPAEAAELQELALRSVPEGNGERPQMLGALELYRSAAAAAPR